MEAVVWSELREKFRSQEWDPRLCKYDDIKGRWLENHDVYSSRKVTLAVFGVLYRRASAEAICERWKDTRKEEKMAAAARAQRAAQGVCVSSLF